MASLPFFGDELIKVSEPFPYAHEDLYPVIRIFLPAVLLEPASILPQFDSILIERVAPLLFLVV